MLHAKLFLRMIYLIGVLALLAALSASPAASAQDPVPTPNPRPTIVVPTPTATSQPPEPAAPAPKATLVPTSTPLTPAILPTSGSSTGFAWGSGVLWIAGALVVAVAWRRRRSR